MKKIATKILSLLVVLLPAMTIVEPAQARTTAAQVFQTAPADIFIMADSLTRLDMIDYFMAGRDTPSRNVAGGDIRLTALSEDSLVVALSEKVTQSLYLLPAKGDTIFAIVKTYRLPALDSSIKFYNSNWRVLDANKILPLPTHDNWLKKPSKEARERFARNVPFVPMQITIDPISGSLTIVNTLVDLLTKEAMDAVKEDIKPAIVYTWDGNKFKAVKE